MRGGKGMVLMAKERKKTTVTAFGFYLSSLLKDRHYDSFDQYADRLGEVGRGATGQMISRYRRKAPVPLWFVADSIEALDMDEMERDKFVSLWLDTLRENERAMMERLWKKRRPEQRDIQDLQDYERQRERRGGENEGGSA